MSELTIAILQPSYMPWLGYFDQLDAVDLFVIYDDVQYDTRGWRNRNRIKTVAGVRWLSVPVTVPDGVSRTRPPIPSVRVHGDHWRRRHLETVRHAYARTPGLDALEAEMTVLFERGHERMADLASDSIAMLARMLGISTKTVRSSSLGLTGVKSDRLIAICHKLGATRYLSGQAARSYLDTSAFEAEGIEVLFQNYQHPEYQQCHGPFLPFLSTIDLLANKPDDALAIIRSGRNFVPG